MVDLTIRSYDGRTTPRDKHSPTLDFVDLSPPLVSSQAYEDIFLIWLQTLYNFAFLFVDTWLGMVEVMVLFVMSEKRARH